MDTPKLLHDRASEISEAARTFHTAAGQPGSHAGARGSLESLEEALQALSAAWYQLAADASPGIRERQRTRSSEVPSWPHVDGLSREDEVRLVGTLHDIGGAFARCARACRNGRSRVMPVIARGAGDTPAVDSHRGEEVSWLEAPDHPAQSGVTACGRRLVRP
jgi:hypothetical protein